MHMDMKGRVVESRIFWTLCIMGAFAILSSTMSKNPVLKPFASFLGAPTEWTGVIAAASTMPGILVSLPAASLSDILGRRKFLIVAGVVFASAPFLYVFITAWWQLILVRFYHGFATAIFVPVAEASIAELYPTRRGERISLFSSVTYVGRFFAPLTGGYLLMVTSNDFHVLYLAVGVAGVTALVLGLLFLVEREGRSSAVSAKSTSETAKKMFSGWGKVASNHGVLLASFVQACQYYASGAVEFFLVGYLTEIVHLDLFLTGVISAGLVGTPILARPYMGRVSDKIGRRIPIVVGCLVGGFALLAIPFVSLFPILLFLALAYGLGFAMVTASTPALVSELVPRELVGTSMGFLDTLMDVGQTIGPIITGLILATKYEYFGSFGALALVLIVSSVIFLISGVAKENLSATQSSRVLRKE